MTLLRQFRLCLRSSLYGVLANGVVFALLFCVGSGISFAAEKLEQPEDFSYRLTNEQILENYLKIAFGNEFGLNKNRKRDLIVKWQENIKPFTFSLAPDSKEIIFIEDILSEVLDITGVKLGHFSEQTDANHSTRLFS